MLEKKNINNIKYIFRALDLLCMSLTVQIMLTGVILTRRGAAPWYLLALVPVRVGSFL